MSRDEVMLFTGYFAQVLSQIEALESPLFRKILTIGVLDTLCRAAFPTVKTNRKRFIAFVDGCSGWLDRDRVSAQQLVLHLDKDGISASALYRLASSKVDSWPDGSFVEPKDDLTLEETMSVCDGDCERRCVRDASYKALFYEYRNHLVHEFREPGRGFDFAKHGVPMKVRDFPYYHGLADEPWQLVFPDEFFKKLGRDSLLGVRTFLINNAIDPYESIPSSSLWKMT